MAHRCPVWLGRLLASPIRKWFQDPWKMLGHRVCRGMRVLDVGCGTGFFSLPLAEMVGSHGKVLCADVQEEMLRALQNRARQAGLRDRIETCLSGEHSLNLDGTSGEIDLAVAIDVIHEISDPGNVLSEVYGALKPGGPFLVSEPRFHVSRTAFQATLSLARDRGFWVETEPQVLFHRSAWMSKRGTGHGSRFP